MARSIHTRIPVCTYRNLTQERTSRRVCTVCIDPESTHEEDDSERHHVPSLSLLSYGRGAASCVVAFVRMTVARHHTPNRIFEWKYITRNTENRSRVIILRLRAIVQCKRVRTRCVLFRGYAGYKIRLHTLNEWTGDVLVTAVDTFRMK